MVIFRQLVTSKVLEGVLVVLMEDFVWCSNKSMLF